MALQVGDQAPDFSDPDIFTGETFKLSDYEGRCVLVAFHGITWCPPCQFAAPILQELWDEEYATDERVQIVIVSVNESPSASSLQNAGFSIPWLVDPAIPPAYQTQNEVPHYFFIDDKRTIYKIQAGTFSSVAAEQKAQVRAAIEECLADMPKVPRVDAAKWRAIATILFGVIEGGGGFQIVGNKGQKIPPGDPPIARLGAAKRDALVALAISELSPLIKDEASRRRLDGAAYAALKAAADAGLNETARSFAQRGSDVSALSPQYGDEKSAHAM